jgi:membrane protease YdiL (CAAX protease family)
MTYAVMAMVMFSMALLHIAVIYLNKGAHEAATAASIWGLPAWMLPIVFLVGGFIDEGGSNEELGWRGFALPVMLEKIRSPLVAALFLGFLWWLWHFPREVPDIAAGKTDWSQFIPGQLVFMGLVICMSVVMTYLFHRTGSVWPAILVHGWGNFATKAVGIWSIEHFDDRLWLFVVAAVLLTLITAGQLGRRSYLAKCEASGRSGELPLEAAA